MLALHVMAAAAVGDSADEDRFPRAVVVLWVALRFLSRRVSFEFEQIEHGGQEVGDFASLLMGDVAGHRQGLQIDLGPHHGCAETEEHASL